MRPYGKHNIHKVLYSLKKTWAVTMDWYQLVSSSANIETGRLDTNWNVVNVRKVILLPDDWIRTFAYPLSFLAANKNFTYGDYYDRSRRNIIVDVRDLPRTWRFDTTQPEFNDKIIIDNRAYGIWKATDFEAGLAYFMTISHIKGTLPNQLLPVEVEQVLNLQQSVTENVS